MLLLLGGCRTASLIASPPPEFGSGGSAAALVEIDLSRSAAWPGAGWTASANAPLRAAGARLGAPLRRAAQPSPPPHRFRGGTNQAELGLAGGAVFAGPQDTKFRRYTAEGVLTDYLFSSDVDGDASVLTALSGTLWGPGGISPKLGLQLDVSHWRTRVHTEAYVDRLWPKSLSSTPPFTSFRSSRTAGFLHALVRFAPPGRSSFDPERSYLYGGLGLGLVYTNVPRGHSGWDLGLQAVLGASSPVSSGVRLRIEGRFTITHDADSPPDSQWRVDTSGVSAAPVTAHLDTTFFSVLIGLSIRL